MTTHTTPAPEQVTSLTSDPGFQAFWSLRLGFAALPILFGIDKFALVLTDNWTRYLAAQINDLTPGSDDTAMNLVGVTARRVCQFQVPKSSQAMIRLLMASTWGW